MEIVPSETSQGKPNALPDTWIERLFQKMEDRYGSLWVDRYNGLPRNRVKATWAEDLAGFTGEELRKGMDGCKRNKFPPTLPEFLTLCCPDVSAEASFFEAITQLRLRKDGKDSWSHPAIYWAAVAIGSSDMMNGTWQTMRGRWTKELNDFMAEVSLPAVPAFAVALPPPGKTTIEPAEAKIRIAAAVKQINAPTDHKAWAKKLIEQDAAGLRPNARALEMAHEALGAEA